MFLRYTHNHVQNQKILTGVEITIFFFLNEKRKRQSKNTYCLFKFKS